MNDKKKIKMLRYMKRLSRISITDTCINIYVDPSNVYKCRASEETMRDVLRAMVDEAKKIIEVIENETTLL